MDEIYKVDVEKLRMDLIQDCLNFMHRFDGYSKETYLEFAEVEKKRMTMILNANFEILRCLDLMRNSEHK